MFLDILRKRDDSGHQNSLLFFHSESGLYRTVNKPVTLKEGVKRPTSVGDVRNLGVCKPFSYRYEDSQITFMATNTISSSNLKNCMKNGTKFHCSLH